MQKLISHDIFEGSRNLDLLSFFDSHPFSALDLFTSYLFRRIAVPSNSSIHVHFLCLEHDSAYWRKRLGENAQQSRFTFHDFTEDPFGWSSNEPTLTSENILNRICQSAMQNISSDRHLVVIDSTTSLLLSLSVNELSSLLAKIPRKVSDCSKADCRTSIVLLHHCDLFDQQSERVLRALSTSCVTLSSVTFNKMEQQECLCQINHQQHQESHRNQRERITISKDWRTSYDVVSSTRGPSVAGRVISVPDGESDPTAKLSFNLRLTEQEKVARSQVQLPHTKGGGVIYYEPDEADDIDYEDPDE